MKTTVTSLDWQTLGIRLAITLAALAIWFWTQALLGARILPTSGIGDALHIWTAGLNSYFYNSPAAANALLISSSALVDALGLFLLGGWIFGKTIRPFLALVLLLGLRQVFQALCALPVPPHMIWHYPGFPSLLVTYKVSNDFFFSGHTAIAVLGGIELARLRRPWLTLFAIAIILFEVTAVLVLRAHYTMDVFTGVLAAFCTAILAQKLSPYLDARFSRSS